MLLFHFFLSLFFSLFFFFEGREGWLTVERVNNSPRSSVKKQEISCLFGILYFFGGKWNFWLRRMKWNRGFQTWKREDKHRQHNFKLIIIGCCRVDLSRINPLIVEFMSCKYIDINYWFLKLFRNKDLITYYDIIKVIIRLYLLYVWLSFLYDWKGSIVYCIITSISLIKGFLSCHAISFSLSFRNK